jgi:hypothetical protein
MKLEKTVYSISLIIAAIAAPPLYYFFGLHCLSGFFVGFALAMISFYSIIKTSYLVVPETPGLKPGTRQKLIVAAVYFLKVSLFIAAMWFLAKSGTAAIIGFIGGFSALLPALLIGGMLYHGETKINKTQ